MKKGLLLLTLLAMLNGCVIVAGDGEHGWSWDSDEDSRSWKQRQRDNRHTLSRLNIGDSRSIVIEQMGEPEFSESFSHNEKAYQVYYYRTHRNKGDGQTTKDETTPVVFVDSIVVGWGDKALQQTRSIEN
jgi:outer membrane protein assembly factor BamE (lipoprotein component of BamABCDE complex)